MPILASKHPALAVQVASACNLTWPSCDDNATNCLVADRWQENIFLLHATVRTTVLWLASLGYIRYELMHCKRAVSKPHCSS
jgi:hypothetical protein